ncbi:right-handed parallel beta-helix repeat-containing protein [Flavobacterium sp.]|uniref:right-handed parallel beta-helix repeat-containing protein n=1 Tax=Flavobacterium sp. TaxID=239 RepID=UPI00286C105B|nr:right-handed parallel beta-helix repeat-containing protein [Flavobacterium sp.]
MKKVIVIFVCILNFSPLFALNYYVDKANGLDTNSGLSLAASYKTIQKAASTAQAGSTIFIKAGTYNENLIINISGTATNPIIFRNYNSDLVYIDGTGTSTANGTAMLQINGASHLEFRNLTIQNLLCQDANGILVFTNPSIGCTNLKFINIAIHDIKWTPLSTTVPTTNDNAHPFLVYGSGNTQASAITNILVEGCNIYNNVTGFSENLTHSGNVDGFVVQNNLVHDNNNIGIECEGNYGASATPSLDHARNGFVRNNKCYNNTCPYSTAAGIYVDGGWDIVVEQNESYNNSYGVEIGCEENGTTRNIMVKNNIFYNNRDSGVYLGGYDIGTTGQVLNTIIRNNSFFQNNSLNTAVGEIEISKASNCRIENNIFYVNNTKVLYNLNNISPQTNITFDYNTYFTPNNNPNDIIIYYSAAGYSNFNSYRTATGQDVHSIYSNPNFVNASLATINMVLQTSSPCINLGNPAVLTQPELDFLNNPRVVNTIDIGAYENQTPLSSPEFQMLNEVKVFPNPTLGILNIESNFKFDKAIAINMLGQKYTLQLVNNKLELKNLSNGIYKLFLFKDNEILESVSIIKN